MDGNILLQFWNWNSEWRSELKVNEYHLAERVLYQKLKLLLNNLLTQLI